MYVTEYERAYTWPHPVACPSASPARPQRASRSWAEADEEWGKAARIKADLVPHPADVTDALKQR